LDAHGAGSDRTGRAGGGDVHVVELCDPVVGDVAGGGGTSTRAGMGGMGRADGTEGGHVEAGAESRLHDRSGGLEVVECSVGSIGELSLGTELERKGRSVLRPFATTFSLKRKRRRRLTLPRPD
jgi:hypothetical protein